MEEEQDQRQFFKDLGATAEQTVQEARGAEEDYFVLLQRMLIAFPWVADITAKLQNYANQNFIIALDFSRELSLLVSGSCRLGGTVGVRELAEVQGLIRRKLMHREVLPNK